MDAKTIPLLTRLTDNKDRLYVLLHRWSAPYVHEERPIPYTWYKEDPIIGPQREVQKAMTLIPTRVELLYVNGERTIQIPYWEFEMNINNGALKKYGNPLV